jgi:hypothetical protein
MTSIDRRKLFNGIRRVLCGVGLDEAKTDEIANGIIDAAIMTTGDSTLMTYQVVEGVNTYGFALGANSDARMQTLPTFGEIARLERLLLGGDGWRCDCCERVFGPDDENHGEDCDLCNSCANEARKGSA